VGPGIYFSVIAAMADPGEPENPETDESEDREKTDMSTLGGIIAELTTLHQEYKDERLLNVIHKLRSATNLWEADRKGMDEMPKWVQEQNRAYMIQKENDAFLSKHHQTKGKAYEVRGDTLWSIGDKVEITKKGSHTGKTAVVTIPDWEGRIMVRMDGSADVKKSYMANELKIIGHTTLRPRTKSLVDFCSDVLEGDKEWGFDVLNVTKKLIQKRVEKGAEDGNREWLENPGMGDVLSTLGVHLFSSHQLSQKFGVDEAAMMVFLNKVESLYVDNPYHNAIHGADCMRTINYFITVSDLHKHLTPLEIFAGLFAGEWANGSECNN
jgi:hypothetical protein